MPYEAPEKRLAQRYCKNALILSHPKKRWLLGTVSFGLQHSFDYDICNGVGGFCVSLN